MCVCVGRTTYLPNQPSDNKTNMTKIKLSLNIQRIKNTVCVNANIEVEDGGTELVSCTHTHLQTFDQFQMTLITSTKNIIKAQITLDSTHSDSVRMR